MNLKKVLPILFLVLLAVITVVVKRCNNATATSGNNNSTTNKKQSANNRTSEFSTRGLDRTTSNLFFTKHAKCRMKCREITQKEVREILASGTVNYNKSDLENAKSPTYAVEGITSDRQHVRIIFAPNQKHLSVVTVIDLDNEYKCNCN